MKEYVIRRSNQGVHALVRIAPNTPATILHHVVSHSPDGFECGYGGSGPADLALSILANYFQESDTKVVKGWESQAWKLHQNFKFDFIAPIQITDGEMVVIPEDRIARWIEQETTQGDPNAPTLDPTSGEPSKT